MAEKKLKRAASPEEVGVSSKKIAEFLKNMNKEKMNFHSFMVLRHGKVAAECWRAPFSPDRPHAMYSVSKSFTGAAVGIAVSEGLLSLDDKMMRFFPEYDSIDIDSRFYDITIAHLLSMTAGVDVSLFWDKSKADWVGNYLHSPFYNEPGVEMKYISENMYMLCAIIHRVTGVCVRDYLKTRLFEPLGIKYPFWETDSYGIEAGGWGLYITTEELAKFMLCWQKGGKYGSKQIIPADYVREAILSHAAQPGGDDYCYCFWRAAPDGHNTFRADGMFSQFGVVFEEFDAIVVVTGGIVCEDDARQYIYKHFPQAFIDCDEGLDTSYENLPELLNNARACSEPEKSAKSPIQDRIDGRTIKIRKKVFLNLVGFPMSILPLAVTYMCADKAGNIDDVRFDFGEYECRMSWREGDEKNKVPCGMDGSYRLGSMRLGQVDYKVLCSAKWVERDTLNVVIHPYETIGKRRLSFRFENNGKVSFRASSEPTIAEIADNLSGGVESFFKNPMFVKILRKALALLPPIVEPIHRGKIKD